MSYHSVLIRSALLAGIAAAATPALAQETADRDYLSGGITVLGVRNDYLSTDGSTATKTPTALIDVPQAVSVITRDQLDDQNIRQLGDALRFVPGVSLESGEGHRDEVFIRGQESSADFYLDGLRDDAQYYRPLYNVERIEVLKGANALIFGRGAGGGAINRVSKQASTMEMFGATSASLDTFGAWSIAADLNAPLSASVAGRINATYEEFASHRDVFDGRFIGISPTLAFELDPATRLTLTYSYDDDRRVTDRGIPSLNDLPLAGYDETFFGDPDYNLATSKAHIARSRIDHELADGVSINATGQYAHYDKFYANIVPSGTDGTNVTLSGYQSGTIRENLIGQVNLVADFDTGSVGHTLLFGFEAMDQRTDATRDRALFGGSATSATVALANTIFVPSFTLEAQRASTSQLTALSVYLQEQMEVTPWLQLVAGIRYDSFDLHSTDLVTSFSASRKDEEWSPRVGIILKPQETLSIYGSFARSFLPASGNSFTVLSSTTASLEPERFENLELGLKWAIRPELFFTAAMFQLDRSNSQAPDPVNSGFVVLTGESRAKGVELSIAGAITADFHVTAGYTYLDGEFLTDTSAAPAGTRLQQLPEHNISLWGRYDLTDQFGLGLGMVHQSDQFASTSNTVVLPSYTRVDAAIFFDLNERIGLQVNVENLFDTRYYPSAHGNSNIQPAKPLNASASLRMKF